MKRNAARLALLLAAAVALPCQATVCFASASALAFGVYDTLLLANTDTTGSVTVSCTPGAGYPLQTSYTITIAGTGSAGDTVRSVTLNAQQRLYYQVYKDAARSAVWSNDSASAGAVTSSVTSASAVLPASQTHTAYARLAPGQRVQPGIYLGSLLVTIDY